MTIAALAGLIGLALVDSTSFGTLVLPIMMLAAPRVRRRNVVVYLGTIAVFYFLIGVALLLGADAIVRSVGPLLTTTAGAGIQAALGAFLIVLSFAVDPRYVARRRKARGLPPKPPGGWQRRALGPEATIPTTMGVALVAGLVEVASMLPYLAAVGILVAADLSRTGQLALLAGYVLVMILPALMLFGARLVANGWLEPRLLRIENWMRRAGGGSGTAWLVGIIGFLVAADGVQKLVAG